ncbi:MAG: hypothetical protein ACI4NZ_02860 [Candidatus Enterousia sp.]
MSRQIQIRRGTVAQHETFTGAVGELTFDGETLRVHDGTTVGGIVLARADKITPSTPIPDNADYVIETWRSDDGSMWYRKYKSGCVDIGGFYTGNAKTVFLPITLANTNYSVMFNKNSSPAYWATTHVAVSTRTTSSFSVSRYGDAASINIGWVILNALCA